MGMTQKMKQHQLTIPTQGRGFYDVTPKINALLGGVDVGLCNVFIRHTSASLLINENSDPNVQKDLEAFMQRLVKDGDPLYKHIEEGTDDMPSHIRCALTATTLTIPIMEGRLALGTWQGVYLWEHRFAHNERKIIISVID